MATYDINVYREGRWWMVEVPEIDGLTQARRVSEIEEMAVSLIAITLDVAQSEVEVRINSLRIGDVDALSVAETVRAARREAEEAEEKAAQETEKAARLLASLAPVRDVGELLGVSYQRVSQLTQ